ncbi:hypothetical protein D3C79_706400 [compost metagenome]
MRAQALVELGQVHRIFGGIADLSLRQRTLQPVRAGLALGQLDAEHFLDQTRIAHGETQVQVTGGQLGVEQRRRQAASQAQQHFKVFAAGVQNLDHPGVFQQFGQRLPVADPQRVDQISTRAVANLDQPGNRIKGINPHELGVDGHEGQLAPLLAVFSQTAVVANPVYFDGHKALPQTMARSIYAAGHCRETARPLSLAGLCVGSMLCKSRLATGEHVQLLIVDAGAHLQQAEHGVEQVVLTQRLVA